MDRSVSHSAIQLASPLHAGVTALSANKERDGTRLQILLAICQLWAGTYVLTIKSEYNFLDCC